MKKKVKDGDPKVYIPPDAKISLDNRPNSTPEVEYELRRQRFDLDAVKDLTQGQYGKKDD